MVTRSDPFQEFTNTIVAALERGVVPWQRGWNPDLCAGPSAPINAVTGRRYHGANVLTLAMNPASFETGDPRWCTYQQAQSRGWQIRKGEKATTVFLCKPLEVENDKRADDRDRPATKIINMLRAFSVFHSTQMDGIPPYVRPSHEEAPWTMPEATQIILDNHGVPIRIGGDRAFYSPALDFIQMPPYGAFEDDAALAAVAMHEASHSTGHPSRLKRDQSGKFGSPLYAMEELVAELSSFMVNSTLGLPTDTQNHSAYMGHWAAKMKEDNRAIFRAASEAQRSASYLLLKHPDYAASMEPDLRAYLERPAKTVASILTA